MKTITQITFCCLMGLLLLCTGCRKIILFEGASDIGEVKRPGHMAYTRADNTYALTGAGLNLWNEADSFFMAWKKVSGNFSMRADIAFEGEGVNPHRKMGIIIREKLTAGSRYADVAVHGDGLTSLQYRDEENGITKEEVSVNKAPTRIYLERKGNKILIKTGYSNLPELADASIEIDLQEECFVGLFICSHEDNVLETGYFRNVNFKKF